MTEAAPAAALSPAKEPAGREALDARKASVSQLIARLQEKVPDGWKIKYSDDSGRLCIYREGELLLHAWVMPNESGGESHPPEKGLLFFRLRVKPLVNPQQYAEMVTQNEETERALKSMATRLEGRPRPNFMIGLYSPETEEQKIVKEYYALREKLITLPEFHFGEASLNWDDFEPGFGSPAHRVVNDAEREKAIKLRATIAGLLTPYRPEK